MQQQNFGKQWKLNFYNRKSISELDDSCSSSYDMELGGCANDSNMMLSPNSNNSGIFHNLPSTSQSQQQQQQRHQIYSGSGEYSQSHQEQQAQGPPNQNSEQAHPKTSPNSTNQKLSIFSKINNVHKVNAYDNLMFLANSSSSVLDDGEDLTEEKKSNMEKLMEHSITDEGKLQISHILEKITNLKPAERLLLYLKMPGGYPETGE